MAISQETVNLFLEEPAREWNESDRLQSMDNLIQDTCEGLEKLTPCQH